MDIEKVIKAHFDSCNFGASGGFDAIGFQELVINELKKSKDAVREQHLKTIKPLANLLSLASDVDYYQSDIGDGIRDEVVKIRNAINNT